MYMKYRLLCIVFLFRLAIADVSQRDNCIQSGSSKWCFTFHSESSTFMEAKDLCARINSALATVPNAVVQNFLVGVTKTRINQSDHAWIGLHWSHSVLRWTSGYPAVSDVFWGNRTPNLNGKCVAISNDGEWIPTSCSEKHPYICSTEEKDPSTLVGFLEHSTYECPAEFHLIGRQCLRFNFLKTSFAEAEATCGHFGSSLLTIRSFREQDHVVAMLADHTAVFWLGLKRNGTRHFWSNPTETEVPFTNWMPGLPPLFPDKPEACTVLHTSPRNLGLWDEVDCSLKAYFICDAEPKRVEAHVDSHLHGGLFVQGRCASGFYEYRSACFSVVQRLARTPTAAPDAVSFACHETAAVPNCSTTGTAACPVVMAPRDLFDIAFQRSLIDRFAEPSSAAWVGLKATRDHVYMDATKTHDLTLFINHSLHDVLTGRNPVCLVLSVEGLLLSPHPCEDPLPALCGYHLSPPTGSNTGDGVSNSHLNCPQGWTLFKAACYRLEPAPTALQTWHEAELTCLKSGAHLVSIGDEDEDTFVRSLLLKWDEKAWVGLKLLHYLDVDDENGVQMQWTDGTPVVYSPLYVKDHGNEDEECVQLAVEGEHKFFTTAPDCKTQAPFVCKKLASTDSVDWITQGPNRCLPGGRPEFCFSVNETAVKFNDAVSACQVGGQHVATILDDIQQDFVTNVMRRLASPETNGGSPQRYWIGLLRSHDTLQWVSGYPAVPNVYWKTEMDQSDRVCVYLDVGLGSILNWGTANCEEAYPFLCSSVPPLPSSISSGHSSVADHGQVFCPLGFLLVNGKCYKLEGDSRNNFTFAEATAKCSRSDGHLATISSMDEQDIITVLVAERSLPFWIGLNTTFEGREWVNRQPITYTNWLNGYPKWYNSRNPLCTCVHSSPAHLGRWAETQCSEKMGFICETSVREDRNPTHTPLVYITPQLFSQDDCAPGFVHHRGACYQVVTRNAGLRRSSDALFDVGEGVSNACSRSTPTPIDCSQARGLAGCPITMTPHSQAEAAFMRLLVGDSGSGGGGAEVWTGLKVLNNNSLVIAQTEDGAALGNVDIDFAHLETGGKPDTSAYTCFALRTDRTFLSARPCSLPAPAICGYYLDTHPLHSQRVLESEYACPEGTQRVGRSCFYLPSVDEPTTWVEAEYYCKHHVPIGTHGEVMGHLPSVHDSATLHFLASFHGNKGPIWLGLTSYDVPLDLGNSTWTSTHLQWSDGSPVDYVAFGGGGSPVSGTGSEVVSALHYSDGGFETCVVLDPKTGLWSGVSCFRIFAFACQFPLEAFPKHRPISSGKYLPTVSECPSSFPLKTEEACYVVVETQLQAKEAQAFCRRLHDNANLLSLHSEKEEADLLAQMAGKFGGASYWMGLSQQDLQYIWADGSVVEHIPRSGVLVNSSHLWHFQDCFTLNPTVANSSLGATWEEVDCSLRRPFICQVYQGAHGPALAEPTTPPLVNLPLLKCPQGYRQHEDRCFKFFNKKASFDDAEKICQETVEGTGFVGHLARISNSREQDFVAGLFGAGAVQQPAMAWLGLQEIDESGSGARRSCLHRRWTDGSASAEEVTFYRQALDFPLPVANRGEEEGCMCTLMLYSSNVHFYGLWSRSACSIADQMSFVCQATPTTTTTNEPKSFFGDEEAYEEEEEGEEEEDERHNTSVPYLTCGDGYTLGFYNRTAVERGETDFFPAPKCLQLVSSAPVTWEIAQWICNEQSATLASVESAAELSFLRVWLQTPSKLGGAGLSMANDRTNFSVWLDLKVPPCPDCHSNWLWHKGDTREQTPVTLTDWFRSPADPSGCYTLMVSRVRPADNDFLRSIRPAASCSRVALPVVCQKRATLVSPAPRNGTGAEVRSRARHAGGAVGGMCVKNPTPEISDVMAFWTNQSAAASGKPCIRWDLVQHNFNSSKAVLPRSWRIFSAVEIAYSEHRSAFWGNHCAHLATQSSPTPQHRYACYTSTDPEAGLEDCTMLPCDPDTPDSLVPVVWIGLIVIVCLAATVLLTVCIVRYRSRNLFYVSPSRGGRWSLNKMFGADNGALFDLEEHGGASQPVGVVYSIAGSSVRVFGAEEGATAGGLVAGNPLNSLVPSLSLKFHPHRRPLHDRDPLLQDDLANAEEFSGPV